MEIGKYTSVFVQELRCLTDLHQSIFYIYKHFKYLHYIYILIK